MSAFGKPSVTVTGDDWWAAIDLLVLSQLAKSSAATRSVLHPNPALWEKSYTGMVEIFLNPT